MISYPEIDPIIFRLGPLAVRWYGMMYLLGFLGGYGILRHLIRKRDLSRQIDADTLSDMLFYVILGVIFGGRFGYVFFYNLPQYLQRPLDVFKVWEGGMSFHGGLLGVIVATLLFCWRRQIPALVAGDLLVTASALGLGLGRVGNFINGELWGRVSDVPWAMVFPGAGPLPRHPSQLYEALLEGLVLLLVLLYLHHRQVKTGVPFFAFFGLYGLFRFVIEFFREPDSHLGFLWGGATMGQLLSLPMILFGLCGILFLASRGKGQ